MTTFGRSTITLLSGKKSVPVNTTIAKSATMNHNSWSIRNLDKLSQKFLWIKTRNPSRPKVANQALPAWTIHWLKFQKYANQLENNEAAKTYLWTNSLEYPIKRSYCYKNNTMNKIAQRKDKSWEIEFQLLNPELIKGKDARAIPRELTSRSSGALSLSMIFWYQDLAKTPP